MDGRMDGISLFCVSLFVFTSSFFLMTSFFFLCDFFVPRWLTFVKFHSLYIHTVVLHRLYQAASLCTSTCWVSSLLTRSSFKVDPWGFSFWTVLYFWTLLIINGSFSCTSPTIIFSLMYTKKKSITCVIPIKHFTTPSRNIKEYTLLSGVLCDPQSQQRKWRQQTQHDSQNHNYHTEEKFI